MHVTLPEELLLFAYDDVTGRPLRPSSDVDYALAGAVLVELSLAGRIAIIDAKVRVLDPAPLGDPVFDGVLERIVSVAKPHKPDWWIAKLQSRLRGKVLDRLIDKGVLRMQRLPVLRVFSVRRYPAVDPRNKSAARSQLDRVVLHHGEPDARTAALATLLNACGLARRSFPELTRRQRRTRMRELGEGQWAAVAVRKALQTMASGAG